MITARLFFNMLLRCLNAATLSLFLGICLWSAYWVFLYDHVHIYAEHGLLESTQAFFLATAVSAFLAPAILSKRPDKLILMFCALVSFSILLRELDVKNLDIDENLKMLGSGIGRKIVLATTFGSIALYAIFNFTYYKKIGFRFIKSKPAHLLMLGGTFLVVGDFFETRHSILHHVFFEEVSELFGYTCVLMSAFAVNSHHFIPSVMESRFVVDRSMAGRVLNRIDLASASSSSSANGTMGKHGQTPC